MHKINNQIYAYVRCIRFLWNEFYRELPDGEHDFADVQQMIWSTLVIKLLHDTMEDVHDEEIVIKSRNPTIALLVEVPSEEHIKWVESTRTVGNSLFTFGDFFDFRNWEDPRELKYVECWTTSLPKEHLLIKTDEVDFYYRDRHVIS